jgi:hypothetical protein
MGAGGCIERLQGKTAILAELVKQDFPKIPSVEGINFRRVPLGGVIEFRWVPSHGGVAEGRGGLFPLPLQRWGDLVFPERS